MAAKSTPEEKVAKNARANPTTGCVEWTRSLTRGGYAQIECDGLGEWFE